jgi:hypothetical protein
MANNSEEGQGSQRAVQPVMMMMMMMMMFNYNKNRLESCYFFANASTMCTYKPTALHQLYADICGIVGL